MRFRIVAAAAPIAFLFGCGGGGGSQQTTTVPFRLAIRWAARSRDLSAPSSALSAVITLSRAGLDESDASFIVKRRQDPAEYSEVGSSPSPVRVGTFLLTVRFYAQDNGAGTVVGEADAQVQVKPDGSLANPDGTALGDIYAVGTIASIEVTAGQSVFVGQDLELAFTARDVTNNVLAISRGSVFFSGDAASEYLSVDSSGLAHGNAVGAASVSASVDGRQSGSQIVLVTTPIQIQRVNLQTNDIAFEPRSGRLFASVPSSVANGYANRVVTIDPATATIKGSVSVGSEPNRIAISDDGRYLYVGIDGAAAVRRVDLQTMTADLQFSLGSDSFFGRRICADLAVMPGSPHIVVVSMKYPGSSPGFAGLGIYDDGLQRGSLLTWPTSPIANSITFGGTPYRLYGLDTELSSNEFSRFALGDYGFTGSDYRRNLIDSAGQIRFFGGAVYSSGGYVVDGENYSILGTYNLGSTTYGAGPTNGFTVDVAANRAYYLVSGYYNSFLTLYEFDRSQFVKISTHNFTISSDINERNLVPRMVLCGGGKLAFNTRGGQHPELGQVVIVSIGG